MPYLGSMLRTVRPLADILADIDTGPAEYRACDAARLLGVMPQTLATWRNNGRVTATPSMNTYTYTADALRRLAQDVHGVSLYDLDGSDEARAAVLRMLNRWNGGVATVQQLHDDAGVKPLPPILEAPRHDRRLQTEVTQCAQCGCDYERALDNDTRWGHLCKSCRSQVTKRARATVVAFLAWCSEP